MGKSAAAKLVCILFVVGNAVIASHAQTSIPLFSFDGTDGANPGGVLVQASDGNLYGITSGGGANGGGTIFRITSRGTLTTLYSFSGETEPDGLIQATGGNLYGTTLVGGAYNAGSVFRITPGGTLTTIYSFCSQQEPPGHCPDGNDPLGLIQAIDGNFYETTLYGGGSGTVFRITPAGALTTLHSFGGTDGYYP
jgi:uncharacterized repeat protein (TIGR03803 family)